MLKSPENSHTSSHSEKKLDFSTPCYLFKFIHEADTDQFSRIRRGILMNYGASRVPGERCLIFQIGTNSEGTDFYIIKPVLGPGAHPSTPLIANHKHINLNRKTADTNTILTVRDYHISIYSHQRKDSPFHLTIDYDNGGKAIIYFRLIEEEDDSVSFEIIDGSYNNPPIKETINASDIDSVLAEQFRVIAEKFIGPIIRNQKRFYQENMDSLNELINNHPETFIRPYLLHKQIAKRIQLLQPKISDGQNRRLFESLPTAPSVLSVIADLQQSSGGLIGDIGNYIASEHFDKRVFLRMITESRFQQTFPYDISALEEPALFYDATDVKVLKAIMAPYSWLHSDMTHMFETVRNAPNKLKNIVALLCFEKILAQHSYLTGTTIDVPDLQKRLNEIKITVTSADFEKATWHSGQEVEKQIDAMITQSLYEHTPCADIVIEDLQQFSDELIRGIGEQITSTDFDKDAFVGMIEESLFQRTLGSDSFFYNAVGWRRTTIETAILFERLARDITDIQSKVQAAPADCTQIIALWFFEIVLEKHSCVIGTNIDIADLQQRLNEIKTTVTADKLQKARSFLLEEFQTPPSADSVRGIAAETVEEGIRITKNKSQIFSTTEPIASKDDSSRATKDNRSEAKKKGGRGVKKPTDKVK